MSGEHPPSGEWDGRRGTRCAERASVTVLSVCARCAAVYEVTDVTLVDRCPPCAAAPEAAARGRWAPGGPHRGR